MTTTEYDFDDTQWDINVVTQNRQCDDNRYDNGGEILYNPSTELHEQATKVVECSADSTWEASELTASS